MQALTITPLPAFSDNYIWLIDNGRDALVVDPGDPQVVIRFLEERQLHLTTILITHHHLDHTGGVRDLIQRYSPNVYGPALEHIAGVTHHLEGGDRITISSPSVQFEILDLAGHTQGHIGYYTQEVLFCGDTLFSAGCGRIFEGTPPLMFAALERIKALPLATRIYCAHEYTLSNIEFALAVEPQNLKLLAYHTEVKNLRAHNQPSIPTTLEQELAINPFLRADQKPLIMGLQAQYSLKEDDPLSIFTLLREWKNRFPQPLFTA